MNITPVKDEFGVVVYPLKSCNLEIKVKVLPKSDKQYIPSLRQVLDELYWYPGYLSKLYIGAQIIHLRTGKVPNLERYRPL